MKKIRRSRRVLAGMLAVMMVAGAAPASLYEGGFLSGTAITASADETEVPQSGENQYMKYQLITTVEIMMEKVAKYFIGLALEWMEL